MFNNLVQSAKTSNRGSGKKLTLAEVLAIYDMFNEGIEKADICRLVGRVDEDGKPQVNSLTYHLFEKQATFTKKRKGQPDEQEVKCRSLMRHLYQDHTDPDTELVDEETFVKRLFEEFGVEFEGLEQAEKMIEDYKASLTGENEQTG